MGERENEISQKVTDTLRLISMGHSFLPVQNVFLMPLVQTYIRPATVVWNIFIFYPLAFPFEICFSSPVIVQIITDVWSAQDPDSEINFFNQINEHRINMEKKNYNFFLTKNINKIAISIPHITFLKSKIVHDLPDRSNTHIKQCYKLHFVIIHKNT